MEILNLHNDSGTSLLDSLHSSLADGQRTTSDDFEFQTTRSISTMSLYSDEGLAIYAEITELKAC